MSGNNVFKLFIIMENKDENKKALTENQLQNVTAGEDVEFEGYHSCSFYDNKAGCESEQHCKWVTHTFKNDKCETSQE